MSSGRNISLTPLDDIFSTEADRQGEKRPVIRKLPLTALVPFLNHPFRVLDDGRMMETVESVREYGVLSPIIVRPVNDGTYEIVSGHRRKRACELAGNHHHGGQRAPVRRVGWAPTLRGSL